MGRGSFICAVTLAGSTARTRAPIVNKAVDAYHPRFSDWHRSLASRAGGAWDRGTHTFRKPRAHLEVSVVWSLGCCGWFSLAMLFRWS